MKSEKFATAMVLVGAMMIAGCQGSDEGELMATRAPSAVQADSTSHFAYELPADPRQCIDLLWGVATTEPWTTKAGLATHSRTGTSGDDWANYTYHHALSKVSLTIQAMLDNQPQGRQLIDSCKITLERVVIRGKFPRRGVLNLNSRGDGVAQWEQLEPTDEVSEVVIDGDLINPTLRDHGPGLTSIQPQGVLDFRQDILAGHDDREPLLTFIPNRTPTDYDVTLEYYVTNDDRKLLDRYTRVKNVETSTIRLSMENGSEYALRLLVGLRIVEMSATVADWGF